MLSNYANVELVVETIVISKLRNVSAYDRQACTFSSACKYRARVHANEDQVIADLIKDFDLDEDCLWVALERGREPANTTIDTLDYLQIAVSSRVYCGLARTAQCDCGTSTMASPLIFSSSIQVLRECL